MRTFAEKPKATQQTASAKSRISGRVNFGQSPEVRSILHLQSTIGNQAVLRRLQTHAEEPMAGLTDTAAPRFRNDFSRIPNHASLPRTVRTTETRNGYDVSVSAESRRSPAFDFSRTPILPDGSAASRTRVPNGEIDSERGTINGGGTGPAPVGGAGQPVPAAPTLGCQIASGPSYTPTGSIPAVAGATSKSFPFSLAATFTNLSPRAIVASCCEVRQFIKWDARSAAGMGGPPHSGFPASTPADIWIEDRDTADKRYGHRSGPHSAPIASGGDEYTTNGVRNQAFGDTYNGSDSPFGPLTDVGKWFFRLDVIDRCNSDSVKASSPVITLNWG